jgi:hypothetical protein
MPINPTTDLGRELARPATSLTSAIAAQGQAQPPADLDFGQLAALGPHQQMLEAPPMPDDGDPTLVPAGPYNPAEAARQFRL